jgi:hypothetical protein
VKVVRGVFEHEYQKLILPGKKLRKGAVLDLLKRLEPAGWSPTIQESLYIQAALKTINEHPDSGNAPEWAQLAAFMIASYDHFVETRTNGLYIRVE